MNGAIHHSPLFALVSSTLDTLHTLCTQYCCSTSHVVVYVKDCKDNLVKSEEEDEVDEMK